MNIYNRYYNKCYAGVKPWIENFVAHSFLYYGKDDVTTDVERKINYIDTNGKVQYLKHRHAKTT